jgi:hypothetical protein
VIKVKYIEGQDLETKKYTLSAEVIEYTTIPREIFVFLKPLEGDDIFQTVTTPIGIEQIPATTATHPGGLYRDYHVSLDFDLLEDREKARRILHNKITTLITDWAAVYPDVVSEDEVEYSAS